MRFLTPDAMVPIGTVPGATRPISGSTFRKNPVVQGELDTQRTLMVHGRVQRQ